MATSRSKRHTHKYYRVALNFHMVWACALPDCNHHMPPHMTPLVEGKASICWKCEQVFVLNATNMKDAKPICEDCSVIASMADYIRNKDKVK